MIDAVECPGQVRVKDPSPLAAVAAQRLENDLDRVVAAPSGPEPVGSRFEPGLPFGFQRVLHACLLHAVGDHRDGVFILPLLQVGCLDVFVCDAGLCCAGRAALADLVM